MKKQRKKQAQIFFFIMLTLILLTSLTVKHHEDTALTNEDFIRFHVIANSDTKEDQTLKLFVRDKLLESINKDLVEYTVQQATGSELEKVTTEEAVTVSLDKATVEQYIEGHLGDIEEEAEAVMAQKGYDYTASAELGVRWIPEKTYGNVTFPAGNYEALNITIGQGKGQNWWCVLFPPLCLIGVDSPIEPEQELPLGSTGNPSYANQDPVVAEFYRNAITEKKYQELIKLLEESQGQGPQVASQNDPSPDATSLKLRFKTLEMINGKCVGK